MDSHISVEVLRLANTALVFLMGLAVLLMALIFAALRARVTTMQTNQVPASVVPKQARRPKAA